MKFLYILVINLFFASTFASEYYVEMHNSKNGQTMTFSPMILKIKVGGKVTFKPTVKGHTSRSIFVPKGAKKWEGKTDEEVSVTFEKAGVYLYECQNHGIMGMNGAIIVGKADNLKEAKNFMQKHKKKLIMNKTRLLDSLKNK